MGKDAKGHGSEKRYEVRQGTSRFGTSASSTEEAKEKASRVGFKKPDAVVLRTDADADRAKAVQAGKSMLGRKIDLSGSKSPTGRAAAPINRRGDTFKPKGSK